MDSRNLTHRHLACMPHFRSLWKWKWDFFELVWRHLCDEMCISLVNVLHSQYPNVLLKSITVSIQPLLVADEFWAHAYLYRKSHDLEYNSWLIGTSDFEESLPSMLTCLGRTMLFDSRGGGGGRGVSNFQKNFFAAKSAEQTMCKGSHEETKSS